MEESHEYHHYDPREPEVELEVSHTTRGPTWKVNIKGAKTPEEAVELYRRTASGLADLMEEKDEDTDESN